MITKQPKSKLKRYASIAAGTFIVAEALGFAVSYGLWYKLNTERDYRYYMYKNYNWVLETYYTAGEFISDQKTRELDKKVWTNEGKI